MISKLLTAIDLFHYCLLKIFEKAIFKSVFEYIEEQKLLLKHQSGFRLSDSCINQLLSIVYDLYTTFDADSTLDLHGFFRHVKDFWQSLTWEINL